MSSSIPIKSDLANVLNLFFSPHDKFSFVLRLVLGFFILYTVDFWFLPTQKTEDEIVSQSSDFLNVSEGSKWSRNHHRKIEYFGERLATKKRFQFAINCNPDGYSKVVLYHSPVFKTVKKVEIPGFHYEKLQVIRGIAGFGKYVLLYFMASVAFAIYKLKQPDSEGFRVQIAILLIFNFILMMVVFSRF